MTVTTRIEEIVEEISTKLDVIQKESVCVGSLLIEAKEELTESGKKYSDFIEWCGVNFNIGKAQASKLMKVATVFKDDERFKGVAMRVLYSLACNATPEQMDRAACFAESGSLNSAVLNQLLNPVPVKVVEDTPPFKTEEEESEQLKEIADAIDNVAKGNKSIEQQMQDFDKVQEASHCETEGLTNEIKELRKALSAANDLIKAMTAEKVKHNTTKEMPMLPQFNSAFPYAVLGLGVEEASNITSVKKAFRELIKCGYGKGHKAFELLTAAKDTILDEIEANK